MKTPNGAQCSRCGRGRIRQRAFSMICDWCGTVHETDSRVVPFRCIEVGEVFYSGYDDAASHGPVAYRKLRHRAGPGEDDSVRIEEPHLGARHGPDAPCVRARDYGERN